MPEKNKRTKSHYVKHNKKPKIHFEAKKQLNDLKVSSKGILATANFLDYGCKREVFDLLNEFSQTKDGVEATPDHDIDAEIAKEIAELKEDKKRFQLVNTSLNNIMFIAVNDDAIDICELVHNILTTLRENKQRKTRFTQRLLPVSHTCYASIEDITKTAKTMLKDAFYHTTPKTFGIIFKSRNNSSISRDAIIKAVASVATDGETFAESNKVDLENPEYAIVINIIKTIAFMGTVKDFKCLSKYNIDELTKDFSGNLKPVDSRLSDTSIANQENASVDTSHEVTIISDNDPTDIIPDNLTGGDLEI